MPYNEEMRLPVERNFSLTREEEGHWERKSKDKGISFKSKAQNR